jgi:protein-tyrosine-phosphatase
MKILILCTGNSCRSQMAHGFLQSFDKCIPLVRIRLRKLILWLLRQ